MKKTIGGKKVKNKKVKILRFSFPYSKLKKNRFTTIRRGDKYKRGDIVQVFVGKRYVFYAKCIYKYKKMFFSLRTNFLRYDILPLQEDTYFFFSRLYSDLLFGDAEMTIYIFEKIVPKNNLDRFSTW